MTTELNSKTTVKEIFYVCSKCGGTGELPQFYHYAQGVCFQCKGTGKQVSKPRGKIATPLTRADVMRKNQAALAAYLPILRKNLENRCAADFAKGVRIGVNAEKIWNYNLRSYQRKAIEIAKREGFWEAA